MAVFKDVTFGYKGQEYTVPANKIMRLIAIVEDVVSLRDLTSATGPKLSKLAEAYTEALNYAGAKADIDSVYESLFSDGGSETISSAMTSLIMLMLPPSSYHPPAETEKAGKQQAAE